ncbi:hypothetical protein IGI04_007743 [Brassica rapa subsp. trilocularis]|uniref:Uncharacterized protein n=1 Tax=Brassica rapa subsp. trilocularis TaxID=1813537 RepID=A0ABQ7NKM5_BRACM|nr:hypothetical protein IGI04_007743 [Brassica rapa subsp. trilocularis]
MNATTITHSIIFIPHQIGRTLPIKKDIWHNTLEDLYKTELIDTRSYEATGILCLRVKTKQEMVQRYSYLFLIKNRAYFTKTEYHPIINLRNETDEHQEQHSQPRNTISNPIGWLMF